MYSNLIILLFQITETKDTELYFFHSSCFFFLLLLQNTDFESYLIIDYSFLIHIFHETLLLGATMSKMESENLRQGIQALCTLQIIDIKPGRKDRFRIKETTCLTEIMLWGIKLLVSHLSFHREATFGMLHCHPQITGKHDDLHWNNTYCCHNSLEKIQTHRYNSLFNTVVFLEGFLSEIRTLSSSESFSSSSILITISSII